MNLISSFTKNLIEAGCDEVGVGSLAGPIVAAAVIFPKNYKNHEIQDSKQINKYKRKELSKEIKENALSWSIGECCNKEVDKINCKNASFLAMHRAIDKLNIKPELLLIDGHIYKPHNFIPYNCIIKGDSKFLSIAAASILAKEYRDNIMIKLDKGFEVYNWRNNVGYATKNHIDSIKNYGITEYHRKTFGICKNKKII
ncbi:MAG: ribonuclease HII [Bacteroidetes bacterium]|nr:ribonuclease HII [Bacteroidota bacterium]